MVEDKVGEKPYLGIIINYDKDKKLDKFSKIPSKTDTYGIQRPVLRKLLLELLFM